MILPTGTVTINNVGNDDPIITPATCRVLRLREAAVPGTTDFFVRMPSSTDAQFRFAAGEEAVIRAPMQEGRTVAFASTAVGSAVFNIICE